MSSRYASRPIGRRGVAGHDHRLQAELGHGVLELGDRLLGGVHRDQARRPCSGRGTARTAGRGTRSRPGTAPDDSSSSASSKNARLIDGYRIVKSIPSSSRRSYSSAGRCAVARSRTSCVGQPHHDGMARHSAPDGRVGAVGQVRGGVGRRDAARQEPVPQRRAAELLEGGHQLVVEQRADLDEVAVRVDDRMPDVSRTDAEFVRLVVVTEDLPERSPPDVGCHSTASGAALRPGAAAGASGGSGLRRTYSRTSRTTCSRWAGRAAPPHPAQRGPEEGQRDDDLADRPEDPGADGEGEERHGEADEHEAVGGAAERGRSPARRRASTGRRPDGDPEDGSGAGRCPFCDSMGRASVSPPAGPALTGPPPGPRRRPGQSWALGPRPRSPAARSRPISATSSRTDSANQRRATTSWSEPRGPWPEVELLDVVDLHTAGGVVEVEPGVEVAGHAVLQRHVDLGRPSSGSG